jgi:hypothetical protein
VGPEQESHEEELRRLEAEIEDSRRRQTAFERYVAALGALEERGGEAGDATMEGETGVTGSPE